MKDTDFEQAGLNESLFPPKSTAKPPHGIVKTTQLRVTSSAEWEVSGEALFSYDTSFVGPVEIASTQTEQGKADLMEFDVKEATSWSIEGVEEPTREQYFHALVATDGAISGLPYRKPDSTLKYLNFGPNENKVVTYSFRGLGSLLPAEGTVDRDPLLYPMIDDED